MGEDQVSFMLNDGLKQVAELGGNQTYDVLRPDYTDPTTSSSVLAEKVLMRTDRNGGSASAEPFYPSVQYYSVGCDRYKGIDVGDILVPNPRHNAAVPNLTVQNFDDKKEMVAFRSGRTGALCYTASRPLFTNVLYETFGINPPDRPLELQDMEGSLPYEIVKAIMWKRVGIINGMRLIDSDDGQVWDIQSVTGTGQIMILFMRAGKR